MSWLSAVPQLCLVFLLFLNLIPGRHRKLAIIPGIIGVVIFAYFETKAESARVNREEEQNKLLEQQRELVQQQRELVQQQSKLLEQQRENLRHEDERQEQLAKYQRDLPKQQEQHLKELLDAAFATHPSQ
jgi:ABC-type transport system involved in cytochrome bd biosynthesis fused ATPase/permease subunit